MLATLRETTDEPLDEAALEQARADLEIISERLRQLGGFGGEELEAHYRRLHDSVTALLAEWRQFYEQYNADGAIIAVESARSYNSTQQRLQELDQRQSFVAVPCQPLTGRSPSQIKSPSSASSVPSRLRLPLVFAMIRSTNASLTRMKRGRTLDRGFNLPNRRPARLRRDWRFSQNIQRHVCQAADRH